MSILSSQNALMITKITPFTGNPRDFKRFMANFENNVSRKCADDSIRLNFLIEHCEGDPKSLIEDCVLLKTNAFTKAVELLQEEYGQKTDIAADYLQFLKSGQEIKGTDVDALTKLAQNITKCAVTLKESGMNTTSRHKPHWTRLSTDYRLTCVRNGLIRPMKNEREMNEQVLTRCANLLQTELELCDQVMANTILRNLILLPINLFLAKRRSRLRNREHEASKPPRQRR